MKQRKACFRLQGALKSAASGASSRGRTESGRVGRSIQVGREGRGREERERGKSDGGRRCLEEGGGDRPEPMESEEGGGKRRGRGCCAQIPGHVFAVLPLTHEDWDWTCLAVSLMNEEREEEQRRFFSRRPKSSKGTNPQWTKPTLVTLRLVCLHVLSSAS